MDSLIQSYRASTTYPVNLICYDSRQHVLHSYAKLLKDRREKLFSDDTSILDFWQCDYAGQGFWHKRVQSLSELYQHLRIPSYPRRFDPKCQFIFIHAPHSRDPLNLSHEMLTSILSYHQVMPALLDFVFSFGMQQHAEDFHFSGFRQNSRVIPAVRGFVVPELARSGRSVQMCYSLRSVEDSPGERFPWSIRQTAVYHSFDLESGQSVWIVVKGNEEMKERIISETMAESGSDLRSFENVHDSFSSALATHLLFCEWSAENWRWYINLLEKKVQDITRRTLNSAILTSTEDPESTNAIREAEPKFFNKAKKSRTLTFSRSFTFGRTFTFDRSSTASEAEKRPPSPIPEVTPSGKPAPPVLPPGYRQHSVSAQPRGFSFDEVRRIQLIEERANETLLVLRTNTNVQGELRDYYCSLLRTEGFPHNIMQQCETEIAHFESRIKSLQNNFLMQQARLETLLRLLADRKTLLYGILDYQNMEASKRLAAKGQQSADNMERMTEEMRKIAVKTKQETVSMRIITLVTLFFLPGTFISTLMSTDIIQFQTAKASKDGGMFSLPALRLFMAISIPMMVLTFLAWGGIYWWVIWREKTKPPTRDGEAQV